MADTILVFPSSLEASLTFIEDAKRWNQRVIGASSIADDPYASRYDAWERMPFIHESDFVSRLKSVIEAHGISAIFTPHAPTYLRLSEISDQFPGIRLIGESPYSSNMNRVRAARETAREALSYIGTLTDRSSLLREDFLAALLAQATRLYGECRQEKMAALCAIFCEAPKGDVIEIGTFFGKSAYVLNRLAAYFHTGTTLAIDPWDMGLSVQAESPRTIQALSTVWNWEIVFEGFLLTMEANYAAPFNYIRAPSRDAYALYKDASIISTPQFGDTRIERKIAVLHLDGNHDEHAVAEDLSSWGPHVAPGGWIVFDDYEWSQGDGPRKVADRMALERASQIARKFVAGGAAFFKMKG